jgi:hypothetical protein
VCYPATGTDVDRDFTDRIEYADYSKLWVEAFKAREAGDVQRAKKIAKKLTTGYAGLTDAPNSSFALELAEMYPSAKVIVVERDPDAWWQSLSNVMEHEENPLLPFLAWPVPGFRWFPAVFREWKKYQQTLCKEAGVKMGPGRIWPLFIPLDPPLTRHLLDLIRVHNQRITDNVSKDRVLVVRLQDLDWEPLCKFLDKPVPDEPFPRMNDGAAAEKVARTIFAGLILRWIVILATTAAVPYSAYWASRFYLRK